MSSELVDQVETINNRPTGKTSIYQALFEIQAKNLKYKKNATNDFYNSTYLTLENLLEVLMPVVKEKGLLITHFGNWKDLTTRIVHLPSGEYIDSTFPLPERTVVQKTVEVPANPQTWGSAITYAKRYNLASIFNIVSDEDDDGNATVNNDVDLT